jgi:hypothetical protein
MSNFKHGKIAPNKFLSEFMRKEGLQSNEEAAELLGVEPVVFAALLYSPVQVLPHEQTAKIAPYFEISHEDWFLQWRLGFGEITYENGGSAQQESCTEQRDVLI